MFHSFAELSFFNSVVSLGEDFYGCLGLSYLIIPKQVYSIGGGSFRNNPTMRRMHIMGCITYLGQNSWTNNNMELIEFCNTGEMQFTTNPTQSDSANNMVFGYIRGSSNNIITANNPCKVVLHSLTPPLLTGRSHFYSTSYYAIYVPDSAVDTYKAAAKWSTYASKILPLSEYPNPSELLGEV